MRRIRCKFVLSDTVAKNGSNLRSGRHARAAEKRMEDARRRQLRISAPQNVA